MLERRKASSRVADVRSLVAPLKKLSEMRRAAPLLYIELSGFEELERKTARTARAECKRVVAAALKGSIGSVLRKTDLVAAGPAANWFAALVVGRCVAAGQRTGIEDTRLGTVAARLRAAVQRALNAAERSGDLPSHIWARSGWTFIEPVHRDRALQELRQAIRGAAVVARIEEQRATVLACITHELRTPLTSIIGYAELLTKSGGTPANKERFAAVIAEEAARLRRLVDGLIDLGAWSASKLELQRAPLQVRNLVEAAERAIKPNADKRGVRIAVRGRARLTADRERLLQIVINLLDNAVRHAKAGGVVRVSVGSADRACTLVVADDGPGFAAAPGLAPGSPFARGANGHVGLGLSIVKVLVEAHGGTLRLTNGTRRGARVEISIPDAIV